MIEGGWGSWARRSGSADELGSRPGHTPGEGEPVVQGGGHPTPVGSHALQVFQVLVAQFRYGSNRLARIPVMGTFARHQVFDEALVGREVRHVGQSVITRIRSGREALVRPEGRHGGQAGADQVLNGRT